MSAAGKLTPGERAVLASVDRGEGWAALCTDCDQYSTRLTRAEAEVWPALHRVLSPTCRQATKEPTDD